MPDPKSPQPPRDDAEIQPESGYPEGRIPSKPSAELAPEAAERDAKSGSEAEFDSRKIEETKSRF
jgi:hypothetical protein